MQAELQGWHVVAGHDLCKYAQGPLQLTSQNRQRGEGSWLVKPRMSGFCGGQAVERLQRRWRFGPFGHLSDQRLGRTSRLSCGNALWYRQQVHAVDRLDLEQHMASQHI